MNKVVLVTGGNRGIGKEICNQLSSSENQVFMGSRSLKNGEAAASELSGKITVIELDTSSDESVKSAFDTISSQTDHIDAIINNAGIGVGNANLEEANIEEVKEIFEVNFFGPMRVNSIFLPLLMESSDPRIINVSSGMGTLAGLTGGYEGYRLSKAGLNAQTIQLANELQGRVKVFSMCPGWVRTDMGGPNAGRSVEQGADTAVWLVSDPDAASGRMYRDRMPIPW